MPSVDIRDARVLVLGGSGVLGGAIAKKLAERSAKVVLTGRDEERLRARALDIGGIVPTIVGDLSDSGAPMAIVQEAAQLLEGLDGLVNAAGSVAFGNVSDLDDAVLDELMMSNVVGPTRAIREATKHIDRGFVVSISGLTAETPVGGMAAYSAAKAAMSAMVIALAREVRAKGIHVLDARPPHTETGLVDRALSGTAPPLPVGLDPRDVAFTIVEALSRGKRVLSSSDFGG